MSKRRKPRPITQAEVAAMLADRKAGLILPELEKKYDRSRSVVCRALSKFRNEVPAPTRKRSRVQRAQAALRASQSAMMLSYGGGRGRKYEQYELADDALKAAAAARFSGASDVRLWREVRYEITAKIKGE